MRTFDFAPFYRSTVGFDRLFSLLDQVSTADGGASYPPYNIERTGDDQYQVAIAVAGFAPADLSIETKDNVLLVRGGKREKQEEGREILHHGIGTRAFERRFQLADYVQVRSADLENGLLIIDLQREVPEAMKPRQIPINGGAPRLVDSKAA
jgi:molecular chaperone IbpA